MSLPRNLDCGHSFGILKLCINFVSVAMVAADIFLNIFDMAKVINDANIAEVLASGKPVVIDFWATWCGPCRVLGPTVEEVAEEYADKAIVAKCNVDDCEDISMKYGIRNIPTLVFIKNGEVVDRTVGVVSKQDITSRIENFL